MTITDMLLNNATTLLSSFTKATNRPEPHRLDVTIEASDLVAAVQAMHDARWGYLAAITGLDRLNPAAKDGVTDTAIEALYHFCSSNAVVTLRTTTPRKNATLPTICGVTPSADLFERELSEMFGITIDGTPDANRLLLPDDWPSEVFPLRKVFDQKAVKLESSAEEPEPGWRDGKFIVPIGPQHPALKEPGFFQFSVDGETVTGASIRLGYVHRGIERATEERNWVQNLYLLERICGICSHSHAMAYAVGVEQLAKVEAPLRAQAIRELAAGLERIHSHLLWLGVAAHEAGFDTLFMYSWRDRETVMNLLERVTGNRVNYSANLLGGVKCDIGPEQANVIKEGLDFLETRIHHYIEV